LHDESASLSESVSPVAPGVERRRSRTSNPEVKRAMGESNDRGSVKVNLKRHKSGCWTWVGAPMTCNVYRYVAEALGAPLPNGHGKLYRMPNCTVGRKCVNPNHIGTIENYWRTLDGRRQDTPEPCERGIGMKLTPRDKRFLKTLKIGW
jgi:hypothetical protein